MKRCFVFLTLLAVGIVITPGFTQAADFTLAPKSLTFSKQVVGSTSPSQSITLTNTATGTVNFTLSTVPNYISSSSCSGSVAKGGTCSILVSFSPTTTGTLTGTLVVSDGSTSVSVSLTGTGVLATTVSPTSIAFGEVAQNSSSPTSTITLTNNQAIALNLISASSPNANYSVLSPANGGCSGTLAPNTSCTFTVVFTPQSVGAQNETLVIADDATTSPQAVTITGTGVVPITVSTTSLTFATQVQGTASTAKTVTLTNKQSLALGSITASIVGDSSDFSVSGCTSPVAYLGTCKLSVTFSPQDPGTRNGTLVISSPQAPGGTIAVPLSGVGEPPITITPASPTISFATTAVGLQSKTTTITVKNNQKTALTWSSYTLTGDYAIQSTTANCGASGAVLAAGASCTFKVMFQPTQAGTRLGSLTLNDNAATTPQVIPFIGVGIDPITANLETLAFATQYVGTTSPLKQIIIKNHQDVADAITEAVSAGFTASDDCNGLIPADSSCNVWVGFSPSSATKFTGQVTVTESLTSSRVSVTLTGTGTNTAPKAAVVNVSPGAGQAGTSFPVVINGVNTQWSSSSVLSFGTGITFSNQVCPTPIQCTATVTIASNATPGARTVTVTTGTQKAMLTSGFAVATTAGLSFQTIAPASVIQGAQDVTVTLHAAGAHFQQGVTYGNFGAGITINSITVTDDTDAVVNVSVSPYTTADGRQITLVTGGEFVISALNALQVTPDAAQVTSVSPNMGQQGANILSVVAVGSGTNFLQGATQVSFGNGINVGAVSVLSPSRLQFDVAVSPTAAVGSYGLTATTGGETATLANAFTVIVATPSINTVTPNTMAQCQSGNVVIAGILTDFVDNPATVTFGSNITQTGSLTNVSPTSITVPIEVSCTAQTGGRTGDVTSGTSDYPFGFTVTGSDASLASAGITPSSGPQGASLVNIAVTGVNTHWVQGTTQAVFPPPFPYLYPAITVNRVTVTDNLHLVLAVSIPANAFVGSNPFIITTGGEVVSGEFTVTAATPSVAVTPSSAMPGQIVPVNFSGQFTNFNCDPSAGPVTLAVISGAGVSFSSPVGTATPLTCGNPASATATLMVASSALVGAHTITLTTGTQVVTTSFSVTEGTAQIINISPSNAPVPSTALNVTITGLGTNWNSNTTLSFGPGITVQTLTTTATTIHATINIASTAAIGWRTAFVNTGSQELTAPFLLDAPGVPLIVSVAPSGGEQGQTLSNVIVTGQGTNWSQGLTEFIMGAGVTVVDTLVNSPTQATLTLAVSPTAPVGTNSGTAITKDTNGNIVEVDTGQGFAVTGGPASFGTITLQSNPAMASNGETLTLNLVGTGTHWLQGETTAAFNSGVSVDAVNVTSETQASIQVTVLSGASGFYDLTVYTAGEVVTLAQALDVVPTTPALLSTVPNQAQQGATLNIQMLGQSTLWGPSTTASFGTGITVNSFTAQDSVTGIASITVNPLANVDSTPNCHTATVTTGTQEVQLPNQFCIVPGPAVVTGVAPISGALGSTLTVAITGQNTHFQNGLTTASFGSDLSTSDVQVIDTTHATVQVAVPTSANVGLHSVMMSTLGENATLAQAFTVTPQNGATLNGVGPVSGQQGQTLTTVELIGQFTHWTSATPTVTFGQGITVSNLSVLNATTLDVTLAIDPLAQIGGRNVTVTTQLTGGAEVVSGSLFSVVAGTAIISGITPGSGNQGQEVILQITGQNTHWAQGLTQFYMPGVSDWLNDVQVNYFVVNSAASATVDITISPTALLGPRSIYVTTGGEALTDTNAFIVTGGQPVLLSLSPNSAQPGASNLNVEMIGADTKWLTGVTTTDFGPGITVQSLTVNNDTDLTAIVNVDPAATVGLRTVTVRNGTQSLSNTFNVTPPPTPFIGYYTPYSGLLGQTLTLSFTGVYTQWDPAVTQFDMGSDITVNSFQVTGLTSAIANITIPKTAVVGAHTITLTTNTETEQAQFTVIDPSATGDVSVISIIDASSGMQGQSLTVNVIGQYTAFDSTTTFNFGPGITVGTPTILGSTIANVPITIGQLAEVGFRSVTVTTAGVALQSYPIGFTVTPSTAVITSVTPNSGNQGDSADQLQVVGMNTHWGYSTTFSFGGGVTVTNTTVTDESHATLTVAVAALATPGSYDLTATTSGEMASLNNAFVVIPATPLILSSGPASGPQQGAVTFTILGQSTSWQQGVTTVNFGPAVNINTVTVTGPTSITATGQVVATAYTGYETLTVATGNQILTLPQAFFVTSGPAAIAAVNPPSAQQDDTLNVEVTGANTNFNQAYTVANFGPGISVNSVTVNNTQDATVNITVSPTSTIAQNSVTMTTLGEVATGSQIFTITTAASISAVNPISLAQGVTQNVTVTGTLTSFNGTTQFNFGPGITVNQVLINSALSATVNISVSPIATLGPRTITATTGIQVATSASNLFNVTAGPASLASVTPNVGSQNTNALAVTITGYQTHFTQAEPVVFLGTGITVTNVVVDNDTALVATVNIAANAPQQSNLVTVTTAGEVATLLGGFTVQGTGPSATPNPQSAHQGTSATIAITGSGTNFGPATVVDFGGDITVGTVTVNGPTSMSVPITIDNVAALGQRSVTITTGSQIVSTAFTVIAGVPVIAVISPNTIQPTQTETVTVTGAFTNWSNGEMTANFGPGIAVGGAPAGTFGPVTLNSATSLTATLVTSGASNSFNSVQIQNGSQTLTVSNGMDIETCTTNAPTVLQISPANTLTNVPLNAQVQIQFSGPMNRSTFSLWNGSVYTSGSIHFYDTTTNQQVPGTITLDASGMFATIAPSELLPAGRQFEVVLSASENYIQDVCGNNLLGQTYSFTTAFSASATGPSLTGTSPVNGDTNIPLNAYVDMHFSTPIDPITAQLGLSMQSGGVPVPGTFSYGLNDTEVAFSPISSLSASTVYTVSYTTQITDTAGNALTNPGSFSFTTGTAAVTTAPSVTGVDPANDTTGVGINVTPRITFSEAVDGLTVPGAVSLVYECDYSYYYYGTYCYNNYYYDAVPVLGTVTVSADRLSATFEPNMPLQPSTLYGLYVCGYSDIAGNNGNCSNSYFYTGTGAVTNAATVSTISPVNQQSGVPLNTQIIAVMSDTIDPTSISNNSITLTPQGGSAIAGTVTLASDGVTLTFAPGTALNPTTIYDVSVGGFNDVQGNPVTTFTSSFTSGTATYSSGSFALLTTSPGNGAINVSVTSPVTFTMNNLIDPASVNVVTAEVYINSSGASVAGTFSVNGAAVTFTPQSPYPANTVMGMYIWGLTDEAGNAAYNNGGTFTTANTATTTPPTVTISPANGTVNVGLNAQVVLTFSKSINPATITTSTLALFNGDTSLSYSYNVSSDNRTVVVNYNGSTLPSGATITVALTGGIQDLLGNPLVPTTSQFTLTTVLSNSAPYVISMLPGNGATNVTANTVVTLYTNTAMNASTVTGALQITDNGVPVSGTVQLFSSGQSIEFTPANNFGPGDLIQVFLNPTALSTDGVGLTNYSAQFTVAGALSNTEATVEATNPFVNAGNVPLNTVIQVQYDQPLAASTINSTDILLYEYATETYLSPTLSLVGGGQVINIAPASNLVPGSQYRVCVYNVTNTDGVAAQNYCYYFTAGTAVDAASPTITSLAPTNHATNIGTDTSVSVSFNKPINPISVTGSTIQLSTGSTIEVPSGIGFSTDYTRAWITPQSPLPPNTQMTVTINGVTSEAGVSVAPTTTVFTTSAGPDFTSPYVVSSSVQNGQTNVPVNSVFSMQFNTAMDIGSLDTGDVGICPYTYTYSYCAYYGYQYVPATISWSADQTTVYVVPTSPLAVGTTYSLQSYFLWDLVSNAQTNFNASFTTAFAANTTAPTVINTSPENTETAVPINAPVEILFSEPVQPTSISHIALTTGGNAVAVTSTFSDASQLLTLTPALPLSANANYTLQITGVSDTAGNLMTGTVTNTFTTGPTFDLVAPSVTVVDPPNGAANVGTNVTPRIDFSERINPLSVVSSSNELYYSGSVSLYDDATGQAIPGAVSMSSDRLSATITPNSTLQPNTAYTFYVGYGANYYDVAGNAGSSYQSSFVTGGGSDTTHATVSTISPVSGQSGVPLNAQIIAVMSDTVDPTTITNSSITVTPSGGSAVAGIVTLASDGVTLTFVPSTALTASTLYNVSVGGFKDVQGNLVTTFTSSFTVGTGSFVGGSFAVSTVNPGTGANGVTVTQPVMLTMSNLVNRASVNANTVFVTDSVTNSYVAGTYSVSGSTVTFTPLTQYPANTLMQVGVCNVTDEAGNSDCQNPYSTFTTQSTGDTTPPTVTITPANGTTNAGLSTQVVLTFSKSINPATITSSSVNLLNGDVAINPARTISSDNRTVILNYNNSTLPANATLTVTATNQITDLSGNALANTTSQFTTIAGASTVAPTVISMLPGNGATSVPLNSVITLFTSASMNAGTINGALHISQNGVIISGTINVGSNGQSIEFTPSSALSAGATVQVFLDSTAQDIYGNLMSNYSAQFTAAGALSNTEATVQAVNPFVNATGVPLNTVIQVQYNQPLAASSINNTDVQLYEYATATYLSPTLSLVDSGQVVNIAPASNLIAGSLYRVCLNYLTNTDGVAAQSYCYSFTAGTATDTVAPTISTVAPPNSSINIGTNAAVSVDFNKAINPISVTGSSIQLSAGGVTDAPSSISFTSDYQRVVIVPQAPLPSSTQMTIAISGVTSQTGAAVASQNTKFTTMAGPDFTTPYVVNASVASGETVGTNAVLAMQFNEPMDPGSADGALVGLSSPGCDYSESVPTTISWSSDLTTVFVTPTGKLTPSTQYYMFAYYLTDLTGNAQTNYCVLFDTGTGTETSKPSVKQVSPPKNLTGVPLNAPVSVLFSENISGASLSGITLTDGSLIVPTTTSLFDGDQGVQLQPLLPLSPNTTYTINVAGVVNITGNAQNSYTSTAFTTGTGTDLVVPTVMTTTPGSGAVSVPDAMSVQVTFSEAMDPAWFDANNSFYLFSASGPVSGTITFSNSFKTVTLNPSASLAAGTNYCMYIGTYTPLYDLGGNREQPDNFCFTTQ